MTAAIRIENLRVEYALKRGSRVAVDGIDLTVEPGETVAIVGESGSGKSTLSRALLGITPPNARVSADVLEVAGVSVHESSTDWDAVRGHKVGYIPQDPGVSLNPMLTIGKHFAETYAALRTTLPKQSHRDYAIEALERVGLSEPERRLDQRPGELSGGMRQRVLIALALVGSPAVLVADEPTSALDVTVQRRVLDLLGEAQQATGTGLLLITHDLAVALDRADRVVVMQAGKVVETGTRDEILHSSQHPYTRRLLRDSLRVIDVERTPVESDETAIRIAGIEKSFGKHEVLSGIDLEVRRGTTLGLIGESGSGKSTLARIVTGLERPSGGTVDVSATGGVQFVHQNPFTSLDPRWSIERIVAEPLAIKRVNRRERLAAAKEALVSVGLGEEFVGRKPAELSGGQRQRVAIARAVASGAQTIVLDEAVSALDVTVQSQILSLLVKLQKERNLTYLFITHDLSVVEAFADAVAVIDGGTIVEHAPTREVFDTRASASARALLEAIPGRQIRDDVRSAA